MKILFFTNTNEDYLSDGVLHGLKTLYGEECVDFPKCEFLYKGYSETVKKQIRGKGFTLYSGLLEDLPVDRFNINEKIKSGFFDLIIISDIQNQFGWFVQYRPWLNSGNTIVLDGMDTPEPYPYRGLWWRRPYFWFLPKAHRKFLYFKRELLPDTQFNILHRILPKFISRRIPKPRNLRPVSFSIPAEKISTDIAPKTKDFPVHIVDDELRSHVPGSVAQGAFETEFDYYHDLQSSRYGITTKRAGWDCLRHYEIAANGTVICFKDFHTKPELCAPHGLTTNFVIDYSTPNELLQKISQISDKEYNERQRKTLDWAREYTTEKVAARLIEEVTKFRKQL